MATNAQEIASALVRFVGDLKPLEKSVQGAKKSLDGLSKHKFGKTLTDGALAAARGMLDLSKNIFYVREALSTVIGLAGKFARAFLEPALALEKTRNALIGIMGSAEQADGLLGQLSQTANKFGLNLKQLQENAVTLAVISEGDVVLADQYAMALARINALRPDLPQMRQLGVVFALKEGDFARASMLLDVPKERLEALAGTAQETSDQVSDAVGDIAAGGEQALGQYTSIVREAEGTGACGKNLAENLKKGLSPAEINKLLGALGASDDMMGKVADSMVSKLQMLQNHWLTFRQTVGMKVLEALAGPMDALLTWLEDNEEKVLQLAEAFGEFIQNGIEKLVEWASDGGLQTLTDTFLEWWGIIKEIAAALLPVLQGIGQLMGTSVGRALTGGETRKVGEGGVMDAVAKTVLRPKESLGKAWDTIGQTAGIGAGMWAQGAGTLLGAGKERSAQWGGMAAKTASGLGGQFWSNMLTGGPGKALSTGADFGQTVGALATPRKTLGSMGAYGSGLVGGSGASDMASSLGGGYWGGMLTGGPGAAARGAGKQQVEVVVSVEDSGALIAYTKGQISNNNSEITRGWGGGGNKGRIPQFGGWGR